MYLRNKKKRIPKNGTRSIRKKNKIASIRSLKNFFPSIIILLGLLSLSFTIVFLIKEINPLIKNQRLKYLCTYELGNKKNINYKKAKLKLNKIVGDDNKFCSNFGSELNSTFLKILVGFPSWIFKIQFQLSHSPRQ